MYYYIKKKKKKRKKIFYMECISRRYILHIQVTQNI